MTDKVFVDTNILVYARAGRPLIDFCCLLHTASWQLDLVCG